MHLHSTQLLSIQEEIGKLHAEIAEFDSMLQKIVQENDQLNAGLQEALTRITGLEGKGRDFESNCFILLKKEFVII